MADIDEPLDMPEPRRFSRRAFVKGCIYASAAGVAAVGAGATVVPLAMVSKSPFRRVEFISAALVSGPAPQGIPLLPLSKGPNGELMGNPAPAGVDGNVLDWYKYCAHEKTVGLQQGFQAKDEFLRYFLTSEKVESISHLKEESGRADVGWYLDRLDQVVKVDDFKEEGWGAGVNWRSQGQTGKNIISAIVVKIDPAKLTYKNAKADVVRNFIVPTSDNKALIGFISFCKHFCCVPGWAESPLALKQGFFDKMFCTCHFSVYDPLKIKGDFFMLQEEAPAEEAAH